MSTIGAVARSLSTFASGVCLILNSGSSPGAEARPPEAASLDSSPPDIADFSLPIGSFFTAASFSNSLAAEPRVPAARPRAGLAEGTGPRDVGLSYAADLPMPFLRVWNPQSHRERSEPNYAHDDLVARTFYEGKRILKDIGRNVSLDRSNVDNVELHEAGLIGRDLYDAQNIRSVLSLKRLSVSVPLHQSGFTKVSLELNADRLYRAARGEIPRLRGSLAVKF